MKYSLFALTFGLFFTQSLLASGFYQPTPPARQVDLSPREAAVGSRPVAPERVRAPSKNMEEEARPSRQPASVSTSPQRVQRQAVAVPEAQSNSETLERAEDNEYIIYESDYIDEY